MSIVVAHNPRPEGTAAVRWAVTAAAGAGTDLDVVFLRGDTTATPVHTTAAERESVERVAAAAGVAARLHEPQPDPAQQLLELSERADMLVVPVRRRSATMKLILGSIVQRVILEASCPVVSVKAD